MWMLRVSYRRAVAITEADLGKDHPQYSKQMKSLALLLEKQIAIRLEKHTSREGMMSTATRLSEVLGNLPPLSSVSCRYSAQGVMAPAVARPARFFSTNCSRDKTTASRAPMAEVPTAIGCSSKENVEVRKRLLSRSRSVLEGENNSNNATVEMSCRVRLPVVKRRRIPVCARSTRAASAVPTGR